MNARVNADKEIERDGNQIEIGGNERYILPYVANASRIRKK